MTKVRDINAAVAISTAVFVGSCLSASAASPTPAPPRPTPAKTTADPAAQRPVEADGSSRNVVARARMLECGHQWSSQKKNGTASGTWKDFSRGCLAQR